MIPLRWLWLILAAAALLVMLVFGWAEGQCERRGGTWEYRTGYPSSTAWHCNEGEGR